MDLKGFFSVIIIGPVKKKKILTSKERVVIAFNFSFLLFHKISKGNEHINFILNIEPQVTLIGHFSIPRHRKNQLIQF